MSVKTLKTPTGNSDLIRFIRAEIERRGPRSFAWFMQQALYHPEHGYYSSGRAAIGRKGDYFTNVSVGPLFGRLLATQFAEIWERLGSLDKFVLVEQGAYDGQFARDLLEFAQKHAPQFFDALRYRIVEPFPVLQERQSRTLEPFHDKVEWHDSLKPFTGAHFSNELLDAMPVRLVSSGLEKLVGLDGCRFVFIERPLSQGTTAGRDPALRRLASAARPLHRPFNQAALDWIDDLAVNLQRGYVVAIDYGHSNPESPGSVQVRAQHRHLESPFEQIGCADITMPVDWTSIAGHARAQSLRVVGFTDQHHFLSGIISEWPEMTSQSDQKTKRQLHTLLHPEMLGRAFQVLALAKNVDPNAQPLAGFKFAREPRFTVEP